MSGWIASGCCKFALLAQVCLTAPAADVHFAFRAVGADLCGEAAAANAAAPRYRIEVPILLIHTGIICLHRDTKVDSGDLANIAQHFSSKNRRIRLKNLIVLDYSSSTIPLPFTVL